MASGHCGAQQDFALQREGLGIAGVGGQAAADFGRDGVQLEVGADASRPLGDDLSLVRDEISGHVPFRDFQLPTSLPSPRSMAATSALVRGRK